LNCYEIAGGRHRFTKSQIVAILKEGEAGVGVAQLTRQHGISAATYCHWKSKYSGAGVSELKRLRELEPANAKLKRMYADLAQENRRLAGFRPSASGGSLRNQVENVLFRLGSQCIEFGI
jgi:putative transposase